MNNLDQKSDKKRKVIPSLPLFWRLFLSLLLLLLLTSVISVAIERGINAQALESRMAMQVAHLVTVRQEVIQTLKAGDYDGVRQIYRNERGLRDQIIIVDEHGAPLYSRFIPSISRNSRPTEANNNRTLLPNPMIQEVVPSTDNYPELQDISVTTPDSYTYTVQLQPRLPLPDLIALQRTHFPVRFGIILLFSLLACYWFSRALSKRIRQVQFRVHRMSAGDYLAGDDLSNLGDDELGALAKDVADLSNRLADSEMSRKQMLSDISHELRSPLARLEVATELTRDYAPNATHYLDRIQKESTRMNELIGQIIHIQSLQMQRYVARPEDCESIDIAMLLDEIGQDVSFEFYDKHVEWQCLNNNDEASDDKLSYTIVGNREQLHSAFENVIRNAFIYSNSHSIVAANIETIKLTNQTSALKISIVDQGSGIDNDNLERIFQPFVRLDASRQRPTSSALNKTSKQEGGYGLGLAIAQAIIAAHQGQISARNREDGIQGLIVEIVLPVSI
ncbi:sensor histidine kinase [Psychrobacter sp. 1U2]|uniref:sensor histidine kinase n=1 Tax=Psychrobacter sp. 1U2 TaxID=3453577 RepID=UPI003F45BEF6